VGRVRRPLVFDDFRYPPLDYAPEQAIFPWAMIPVEKVLISWWRLTTSWGAPLLSCRQLIMWPCWLGGDPGSLAPRGHGSVAACWLRSDPPTTAYHPLHLKILMLVLDLILSPIQQRHCPLLVLFDLRVISDKSVALIWDRLRNKVISFFFCTSLSSSSTYQSWQPVYSWWNASRLL
jgi:hypothetical protein